MLNEHCVRLPKGFRLCHPSALVRLSQLKAWTPVQAMFLEQLHCALVGARQRRQQLRQYMAEETLADPEWLRLTRLCGISLITLYGLRAAIGDIQRFSQSNKLVAYFGLNPSVCQSGNWEGGGALKRHGRGALRALLVQSAKKLLQVNNPLQKWGLAVAAAPWPQQGGGGGGAQTLRRGLAPPARPRHRRPRTARHLTDQAGQARHRAGSARDQSPRL